MANGTALVEPDLKGGRVIGGVETATQVVPERIERTLPSAVWVMQVDASWLSYNSKALEKIAAAKLAEERQGLERHYLAALRRGRYAYGVWPRKADQKKEDPFAVVATQAGGPGTGVFRNENEMQNRIQPDVTVEAILVTPKKVEPEEIAGPEPLAKNVVFAFALYNGWVPNFDRAVNHVREIFGRPKREFWRVVTNAGAGKVRVKPLEEYE